ncbi:MAG: nitrous oxide reductase accessory protein NosL [Geoalkalibacter sp.]|jgi:nitrous oxide reductase accessory protein NosL|uniref:nitrous oxide reductase accessory protein NosL n=1 Tax=Geoalkalibacter sp. TaxID=3041440 RepID=UPI002A9A689C|nr:nitrous oxide reductase accessory protein NosL [Thermodesulfobacteriota bacterium]
MPGKFRFVLLILLMTATCWGHETDRLTPAADDRCAVCGMYVATYPNWVAAAEFSDGALVFFDGPKDMFAYYFNLSRYRPQDSRKKLVGLYVTEYFTMERLSAQDVYFVVGSEVLGPMGHELVPVKGDDGLTRFLSKHGGRKVLRFSAGSLQQVESGPGEP